MEIWREIGKKGEKIEYKWNKIYKRKKSKINKFFKNDFIKSAVNEKKIAVEDYKSLASRKSSESIISAL